MTDSWKTDGNCKECRRVKYCRMKNYEKVQNMSLEELAEAIQCPNEFLDVKIRCNKFEMYALPKTCTMCKMAWLMGGDEDE